MDKRLIDREKTRLRVQRHRRIRREIDSEIRQETYERSIENYGESSQSDERPSLNVNETLGRQADDVDALDRNDTEDAGIDSFDHNITDEDVLHGEDNDTDRMTIHDENIEERVPCERPEAEQLREWALECNIQQTHLDKLLKILRVRLIPELPKSSKTFLRTASVPYEILDIVDNDGTLSGQYVYFGIANGLQKCVNPALHESGDIYLQINVDGLPIYASSKMQFWPILCRVFASPDIYEPFLVTIFCGEAKPLCVNLFLRDFVMEINSIMANGIVIREINFRVHIQAFICDTPARKFLKLTKGHGGYCACERCTVRGIRKKNRMVYPDIDCEERTGESFRRMEDREHHNGRTALLTIEPAIDLVKTFVLDFMHLCCIGVMKRLYVEFWTNGHLRVRLRPSYKKELSRRINALRKFIPCEFQRKLRCASYAGQLKASEFCFILLYCGPIIFEDLLPKTLFKHFLLLHVACRILCSEKFAQRHNERAKAYLRKFVMLLPRLYGRHSVVLNMHNLIHLADDAKNMNCSLRQISCFPFESFLGKLKKLVRTPNQPLAQVCRRIHEKNFLATKMAMPMPRVQIIKKKLNAIDGFIHILKTKYMDFTLTTNSPDNLVRLTNKKIVEINHFFSPEQSPLEIKFEGVVWNVKSDIFKYPTLSSNLDMWELHSVASGTRITLPLNAIETKMVKLELPTRPNDERIRVFAISFLHGESRG